MLRAADEKQPIVPSQPGCHRQLAEILVFCKQDSLLAQSPSENLRVGRTGTLFHDRCNVAARCSQCPDDPKIAALVSEETQGAAGGQSE